MERSVHITYNIEDHKNRYAIRDSIIHLIEHARELSNKKKSDFKILDCGCGVGLFIRDLVELGYTNVKGIDIDATCVEKASQFGDCQVASFTEVNKIFSESEFDLVILSHVLEHMEYPTGTLSKIREITKWMTIAVPNPLRLKIQMKYSVWGKNYSNKGHYHSWDRSHFHNFLTRFNDLRIEKWGIDRVRVIPFGFLRKPLNEIGILDPLEINIMPKILPYYSDSLIALCDIEDNS